MNPANLSCQNEQRRRLVRQQQRNGLDFVEVSGNQLCVHFLGPVPQDLVPANVQITGGQVIQNIQVTGLDLELQDDPTLDSCLRIYVSEVGDFSPYTLKIVALNERGRPTDQPHPNFDPRYSSLTFRFRLDCPSDLDCQTEVPCPPETIDDEAVTASINYLAKDYASFRQLILDRLSLLIPEWTERHVPDLGITLVELLAYVGDYLSYYQDAVATEAYLDTARQRISVRRHVKLLDYVMHEGCNARTWLHLKLEDSETFDLPLNSAYFITKIPNVLPGQILTAQAFRNLPPSAYEVFEPMAKSPSTLYQSHNEMRFYTWGNRECCLPVGTTQATLIDAWRSPTTAPTFRQPTPEPVPDCTDDDPTAPPPWSGLERALNLRPGDILIFEEVKGAKTGHVADADRRRRHAVCLTKVTPTIDHLQTVGDVMEVAAFTDLPIPLVEIEWSVLDALPVAFCVSAIGPAPDCALLTDITVARGNILLVDHGRTVRAEDLGLVMAQDTQVLCEAEGLPSPMVETPAPFRPQLQWGPLTFSQPLPTPPPTQCSAALFLQQNPRQALPQITHLTSQSGTANATASVTGDSSENELHPPQTWTPVGDLLASTAIDRHVVAEIDDQGRARLRFGNNSQGLMPPVGTQFIATYRIGNGPVGNVGAETIAHVVIPNQSFSGVQLTPRNLLPAIGGTAPETLQAAKQFAPTALRDTLQRAITAADYAAIVKRDFAAEVQHAVAVLRWNGSWYEVLVAIDARQTGAPTAALLTAIEGHLHRFRRIGHDVRVAAAQTVPLHIELFVCVHPDYLTGQVKAALLEKLSNRSLPHGELGFFHPDRLTFGQRVSLSPLVAIAQSVAGVTRVEVEKFHRQSDEDNDEARLQGFIPLGPLEIARLDNDLNQPENGQLILHMGGGR